MSDLKRWLPHIGVVLGVSIAIYALFFSSSDEDLIRAKLDMLENAVKVSPAETNIVIRAARVKGAFKDIFDKNVSYDVPELSNVGPNGTQGGRTELAGLAASATRLWSEATVDLDPLAIEVDDAAMSAVATGDATLTATRQSGQLERDSRTVSIRFDKIEGDWLIVSLSVSAKEGAASDENGLLDE